MEEPFYRSIYIYKWNKCIPNLEIVYEWTSDMPPNACCLFYAIYWGTVYVHCLGRSNLLDFGRGGG
jgi:hypothetical protein